MKRTRSKANAAYPHANQYQAHPCYLLFFFAFRYLKPKVQYYRNDQAYKRFYE
jgi:hypothetical protein